MFSCSWPLSTVKQQQFEFWSCFSSSRKYRWPSPAFPERGAWIPGRRSTQWPFHWYQWHPATEVCHAPTQPQPVWGRAGAAAVGAGGAEGEKGEGQPAGTCDGEEGGPQGRQRGPIRKLWRPALSQPVQRRRRGRHQPVQLQLQNQVVGLRWRVVVYLSGRCH